MPLDSVVLQLKSVGIRDVIKFPYPTRPSADNLRLAINGLVNLRALKQKLNEDNEPIAIE